MSDHAQKSGADCAWLHYARPRPHWYLTAQADKDALCVSWNSIRKAATEKGAVSQGRFHIRGQHDFETVEIWRFPSSQAAYDHWQALVEARYSEFFAFSNNIGLEMEDAVK
ncbi:hypothetical protein SAMN04488056_1118 [Cohaesibacter marisflavi]|uniref:Uncharacterized protein n=1 Tax=Cohaesibacter marisflavi TaxID=655353 RepID=A0A1I5J916_9HYPH|nr:hypothetical protein [Cohaesibacter marisflavi]SFO68886.1 hypothetical protein SAMN04488056_1118 [Cohaesibacter marisflavi]